MIYRFKTASLDLQLYKLNDRIDKREKFLIQSISSLEKRGKLEHFKTKSIELKNIQLKLKALILELENWNNNN